MPVPSIADIGEHLKHVPISAVSNWLRLHGKPHTKASPLQFYKKINKWITDGDITMDDLQQVVLDIEENGGKKVFLKVVLGELPQNKDAFDQLLIASGVPVVARKRRSVKSGTGTTLNHMIWIEAVNEKPPYIVIKFSEMQENIKFDPETEEIERIPKPTFVVVKIDVVTGFAEFRFDPPARIHQHKDGEGNSNTTVYENYYYDLVNLYLRGVDYEYFALDDVAEHLVEHGRDFFRIHREQTTTTGNVKQTYVSLGDVRDSPARTGAVDADGRNWIYDDITGYWKSNASGGALIADLYMRMLKAEGSLKFERDCLGIELDYAVQKIRDIKAQAI
jgi:hypothetical protein